jgi:hypothetical protein
MTTPTASTNTGGWTLQGIGQSDGTITYTLTSPNQESEIVDPPLTVSAATPDPYNPTVYVDFTIGGVVYEATPDQYSTIVASLSQMQSTIDANIASQTTTAPDTTAADTPASAATAAPQTNTDQATPANPASSPATTTDPNTNTTTDNNAPNGPVASDPVPVDLSDDPAEPNNPPYDGPVASDPVPVDLSDDPAVPNNPSYDGPVASDPVPVDLSDDPAVPNNPTNTNNNNISTGPTAPSAQPPNQGLTGAQQSAQAQATAQDQANSGAKSKDWRVRLALASGSNYLYNDPGSKGSILQPLSKTDGVIFPYTPTIAVTYAANYDAQSVTHSNYKVYQYQSSSVDSVTITGDFTCQDVSEANYLLAVIHFFRTMTKMFYGQDSNPKNGTPPPLCYIYGMGGYQFDKLPLAITNFTYNLPADVDYIPTTGASPAGSPQPSVQNTKTQPANFLSGASRLSGVGVGAGGTPAPPVYPSTPSSIGESTTWVPTKIQLAITCVPVISRNAVSNKFSLKDYATGNLLRGSKNPGGGMW